MEILPISEMDVMYGDANTGYIKMRASMKDGKYEYRIINACMPVTSGEEVKAIVDDFISRTTNRSKISENRSEISENRSKINENRSKINEFVPDQRLGVKNITAGLMRNVRTLSVVMQPARTLIRLPSTTAAPIWQSRK